MVVPRWTVSISVHLGQVSIAVPNNVNILGIDNYCSKISKSFIYRVNRIISNELRMKYFQNIRGRLGRYCEMHSIEKRNHYWYWFYDYTNLSRISLVLHTKHQIVLLQPINVIILGIGTVYEILIQRLNG